MNALKSKREFLTFNFRQIVVFWHPLRLFQFPLTWELFSFKILNVVLQYYYSSVKNDFWILGISNFHSAHTDSSMYFVVSILYPLCSCMRFHCVCFSDLTVIHILYRSSFDVSGSQISLFPCSIILHGAAPHDSAGFLFQTKIIEFNFWFIVEITVAKIVQMLSFLGLSRLGRRDCSNTYQCNSEPVTKED